MRRRTATLAWSGKLPVRKREGRAQARVSFIWGPKQAYTTRKRSFPVFFFCINGRGSEVYSDGRAAAIRLLAFAFPPPRAAPARRDAIERGTVSRLASPSASIPRAEPLLDLGDPVPGLLGRRRPASPARLQRVHVSGQLGPHAARPHGASRLRHRALPLPVRANLSLLWVIARSAMATTLSRPSLVSWVRSSPLSRAIFCARSSSRASRRRASGGEVKVSSATSSQWASSSQGWLRRVHDQQGLARRQRQRRSASSLLRMGAMASAPARGRLPSRDRSVARAPTRQSSCGVVAPLAGERGRRAARWSRRSRAPACGSWPTASARSSRSYWSRTPAVGDARDQGLEPRLEGGALLGRDGRVALLLLALDQHVEQGRGLVVQDLPGRRRRRAGGSGRRDRGRRAGRRTAR